MALATDLPEDVIPCILEHLTTRHDLYASALVSQAYNRAATPLLYRNLDSRIVVCPTKPRQHILHPAHTIVHRPSLAVHVRSIQESGTVHSDPHAQSAHTLALALHALTLCTNLTSFSWSDDHYLPDSIFIAFLDVLKGLRHLRAIAVKTFGNLGEGGWEKLCAFKRLERIELWCMEGPPRVLQGWATSYNISNLLNEEKLGETLTHLELGRCAGVPSTILISVFSSLPRLTHLRVKGAPSSAIPLILPHLPALAVLDTDYNISGSSFSRPNYYYQDPEEALQSLPSLRTLTVHTSSMDGNGPRELWRWILEITPKASLETLTLHSFSVQGETILPRPFLLALAKTHAKTMKELMLGSTMLTMSDLDCVCAMFPALEELECSIAGPATRAIVPSTAPALHLRTLKLNVQWFNFNSANSIANSAFLAAGASIAKTSYDFKTGLVQTTTTTASAAGRNGGRGFCAAIAAADGSGRMVDVDDMFGREDAVGMMMRRGSRLRTVAVGSAVYQGVWRKKADQSNGLLPQVNGTQPGANDLEFVVEQSLGRYR